MGGGRLPPLNKSRVPPQKGIIESMECIQMAEIGVMRMSRERSLRGKAMLAAEGKGGRMSEREREREEFRSGRSSGGFDLSLCPLPPCPPPVAQIRATGGV